MSQLILPDSRLQTPTGTEMVDWEMPDGKTVRIEVERIYCPSCGKFYGYVPKENTVFACWICAKCFETYKDTVTPGITVQPDEEFCRDVEAEMHARYGRSLTDAELYDQDRDHNLGPALEALIRDSPYPSLHNRSKR